jgi:murein peptide amidase A
MRRLPWVCVTVLAACSGVGDTTREAALADASATTSTAVSPTTPTRAPPTVATTTTTTTTTTLPGIAGLARDALQVIEIGRSVDGRPITAVERGTPGGTVVLVIGVIHGDETAGVKIVERLATAALPPGIDLWLVESMNPDGQAAGRRTNANLVDLNRNFPYAWAPLGVPGDSQYGGRGPASEPETQAIVDLITAIQPDIGIWYHQDLFRIAPGQPGRDADVRARYAELTGLPLLSITGGTYTGVAATWQRNTVPDGVAFIVELGPRLSAAEARVHAAAVLEVSAL